MVSSLSDGCVRKKFWGLILIFMKQLISLESHGLRCDSFNVIGQLVREWLHNISQKMKTIYCHSIRKDKIFIAILMAFSQHLPGWFHPLWSNTSYANNIRYKFSLWRLLCPWKKSYCRDTCTVRTERPFFVLSLLVVKLGKQMDAWGLKT